MDIQMPSSRRPTGVYEIKVFDKIEDEYRLVDVSTFKDLLRAVPGEMTRVTAYPTLNLTNSVDSVVLEISLGHAFL